MSYKMEVLVACVQQDAFKLYNQMHLQTDAVIANQCNVNRYEEIKINESTIKVISTSDRGVGKNRNYALLNTAADILIIADEDMIYKEGYPDKVIEAFDTIKKADMIIFDLNYLNCLTKESGKTKKIHRVRIYNALRYGAARIAVRREAICKANIWFSVLYGGGAPFSCGEDTLFIREALRKNLKIYAFPYVIADVRQENSYWFNGYTKKYYIDQGFLLANAFPILKYFLGIYYSLGFKKESENFNFLHTVSLIFKGIKQFKQDYIHVNEI